MLNTKLFFTYLIDHAQVLFVLELSKYLVLFLVERTPTLLESNLLAPRVHDFLHKGIPSSCLLVPLPLSLSPAFLLSLGEICFE